MTVNLLSQIPLFTDLPVIELDGILAAMDVKELVDKEILFREGDPGEDFYVVTKGVVEVLMAAGQQEELLLNIMREG
ncbi:MAG: cyclic nucleotide-binding domain-containing protein, partial [Anaerolineales bacterium]|nr:cyclic nucleotide-binding domain-containing protein [Anaerolineales bacterium]